MSKIKYHDLRKAVIKTCLAMNEEGINQGTSGNVSVRTDEGFPDHGVRSALQKDET